MVQAERSLHRQKDPEIVQRTKVLLFDLYDTTVDLNGSIRQAVTKLQRGVDVESFARDWRQQYGDLLDAVRDQKRPWADLDTLMREGLKEILPKHGLSDLSEENTITLIDAWYHPNPWDDSKEGLQRLKKKGYTLATMSNATETMQREIAKKIGVEFDAYFSPDNVRAYKQNPRMFLQALTLGSNIEITMVTNWPGDFKAAASNAVGFNTVYVYRSDDPSQSDFSADITVRNFTELAEVFGA